MTATNPARSAHSTHSARFTVRAGLVRHLPALALLAGAAAFAPHAMAQATIDQTKALAGNLTPGDAAGFPITLSQPGSYKLMSNLYVPAGADGIQITASDVSLDLNGFSIFGGGKCTRNASTYAVACQGAASDHGIRVEPSAQNASIRNGGVSGFRLYGIYIQGTNGSATDLRVTHNGNIGINGSCLTHNVQAMLNGSEGILVWGTECLISNSIATQNGGSGISGYATVQRSNASGNFRYGFYGVVVRESRAKYNKSGSMQNGTSIGGNMFESVVD